MVIFLRLGGVQTKPVVIQELYFLIFIYFLHFYFCSNRITRDGARCLAGLLRQNDVLQILDLSFNRIEDDGAVCLSDAIALPHTKLRVYMSLPVSNRVVFVISADVLFTSSFSVSLSIQSNNVSTVGLLSLSKAINANPHLTHIYIWGNRLEEPVCVVRLLLLLFHTRYFKYSVI